MGRKRKRNLVRSQRKNPLRIHDPLARRRVLRKLSDKHGPAGAMRRLKTLVEEHPELGGEVWEDAKWLARNPLPRRRNPQNSDLLIDRLLEDDEPIRSFPRCLRRRSSLRRRGLRRNPRSASRQFRSRRFRRNPNFEWGPKVFDPFKDEHPFGKRPTSVRINPSRLFAPSRKRTKRRKNPDTESSGGLFTSIYARNKRYRSRKRWKK